MLNDYDRSDMARLTVSYTIAFIPGLPRPLALSEVIDDVLGLSSFPSRHAVRKSPGTPDRLDIIVPVDDLTAALDSAATAADELTRIGESLLGLGFVVEERAIRIDNLTDNWVAEAFDGAGARHHASTQLDAAAPLPEGLGEPLGDVPDEDLHLDDAFARSPAADQPHPNPFAAVEEEMGEAPDANPFAAASDEMRETPDADPFAAAPPGNPDLFAPAPRSGRSGVDPFGGARSGVDRLSGEPSGVDPFRGEPSGVDPSSPRAGGRLGLGAPALHRHSPPAARRRDLARHAARARPAAPPRRGPRMAFALFATALVAVVAPCGLTVSTASIAGLALAAAAIAAGVALLWPTTPGFRGRTALSATATLAIVLAFASAFALCAHDGDLRSTTSTHVTVGQSLSAAVSLGGAPGLHLGPRARAVTYAERLLVLLAVAGAGAALVRQSPSRTRRRE
jgi:hypothetical protein